MVNNTSSSTRIRWTGSSEMMDGNSVGIQVEYQETADGSLGLRHANINYAGDFGKITIGQGSEAGDGSAYKGGVGTFGIGHGQEKGSGMLGDYFGSLDAGTRTHMIRYDTPAIGPVGAALSVGNDDRISAAVTLSTEFSGSSFNAMVASLREDSNYMGKAQETIGASFGVSMASGLGISGAWARGDNHGSKAATDAMAGELGCFDSTTGAMTDPVPVAVAATNEGVACATGSEVGVGLGTDAMPAMHGNRPELLPGGDRLYVRRHHRRGELVQLRGLHDEGLGRHRDRRRREPQPAQGRGAGVRRRAELRRDEDVGRPVHGRDGVRRRNPRQVLIPQPQPFTGPPPPRGRAFFLSIACKARAGPGLPESTALPGARASSPRSREARATNVKSVRNQVVA